MPWTGGELHKFGNYAKVNREPWKRESRKLLVVPNLKSPELIDLTTSFSDSFRDSKSFITWKGKKGRSLKMSTDSPSQNTIRYIGLFKVTKPSLDQA